MNLKPGNLVLVKADTWKGKRKIKDRWEEETWEVIHKSWLTSPLTKWWTNTDSDKSSTETNFFSLHQTLAFPCVWPAIIHRDKCTSPTSCKTTSVRGDEKRMPQEKNGKVLTRWPTSKASLGSKNGKLWLIPWTSTGASTEDGWRPQVKWFGCRPWKEHVLKAEGWCLYQLMLADMNWKRNATAHQTGSWQAWQNKKGVSNPHVRVKDEVVCLSDAECSYPPRGTPHCL